MGYEFDDNGKYIGWSDLFDYSGIEELKASEYLPIPTGTKYEYKSLESIEQDINNILKQINNSLDEDEKKSLSYQLEALKRILPYDISTKMRLISSKIAEIEAVWKLMNEVKDPILLELLTKRFHTLKAEKIKLMAFLLRDLSDYRKVSIKGKEYTYLVWDSDIQYADDILSDINKHSSTVIPPTKLEKCLKNSVASSITNIILNLRNMDQAYSPIEMKAFRKASELSSKGSRSERMTLLNPLTKFVMLEQNMVGKGVIGITAVGEKVFFNVSHYWNEGIRSRNEAWIKNLQFSLTFDRILGRFKNAITSVEKTTLANVNFESDEEMRKKFIKYVDFDTYLRNSLYITDLDILEKNAKWHAYNGKLLEYIRSKQDSDVYADDIISLLLSCATDNAKELILAKINAGTNLARCYLHLIMMGFDVKDIVSFMTSDAVSLVNDISLANMFDEYMYNTNIEESVRILLGNFPVNKFFYGSKSKNDEEEGLIRKKLKDLAFNTLHNSLEKALLDAGVVVTKMVNGEKVSKPVTYKALLFLDMLHDYYICRLMGRINKSLVDFIGEYISPTLVNNNIMALSDYIDNIIERVKATGTNFATVKFEETDFGKDLNEFSKVYELATETSTLGSTFLGLNLGIPTSKADLLNKVINIQKAVSDREEIMSIDPKRLLKAFAAPSNPRNSTYLSNIVDRIKANSDFIDSKTVLPILKEALNLGIVGNFDFFKWLENANDYRRVTSDYYNLIKGTWNIFDIIERLPHFESIFLSFNAVLTTDKVLIKKSHILNLMVRDIFGNYGYMDLITIGKLIDYVDDLLILRLINKWKLEFPISKDDTFFMPNWKGIKYNGDSHFFTIDSETTRGTFKKLFEEKIFPMLLKGYYIKEDGSEENIGDNKFIQNLDMDIDLDGRNFLKLNLDMLNISGTAENESRYLECLTDFVKLKNYRLGNNYTLADWFMFYNLLVHKNLFGSDRLTTLFGPFVDRIKEKSFILRNLLKTGEFDYSDLSSLSDRELLNEIGYNREDALLKIAPIISVSLEANTYALIVKEKLDGLLVYKRKKDNSNEYNDAINIIPNSTDNFIDPKDSRLDKIIRQRNWIKYGVISTPIANKVSSNITNLNSGNIRLVMDALRNYMKLGIIEFYTENC